MLVELRDTEGHPLWLNPDYVVRVDWVSANACTLTLAVVQEFNNKTRPVTVNVPLPAEEVVNILAGRATMPAAVKPG